MYGVDLVSVIFRSAFAHDTQALTQASWCEGAISYNSQSQLVFLQGKVNSARYIAHIVNPELLPFFYRNVICFFSRITHVDIRLLRHKRALCGVQQLSWPARTPDLSPIEHVWDMMKRELTLSPEPATTIAELR